MVGRPSGKFVGAWKQSLQHEITRGCWCKPDLQCAECQKRPPCEHIEHLDDERVVVIHKEIKAQ